MLARAALGSIASAVRSNPSCSFFSKLYKADAHVHAYTHRSPYKTHIFLSKFINTKIELPYNIV